MKNEDRLKKWRTEAGVSINLGKRPGDTEAKCLVQATDAAAAVQGMALLMEEMAEQLGQPVQHVLCVVATVLLAPKENTEQEGTADAQG